MAHWQWRTQPTSHRHGMPHRTKEDQARASRKWYVRNRALVLQRKAARHGRGHIQLFAAWQRLHIHRCDRYPRGVCCTTCHRNDDLLILDLPGGDVAYVCCAKRYANRLRLTDHSAISMHNMSPHALDSEYRPDAVREAKEIAKLPPGLLRTYLESGGR